MAQTRDCTEEVYGLRYLIDNGSGDSLSGMMVSHAHQQTYQDQDGGEWLLSYLFDSFERFHEFVTDYYEITVDKDLLRKLYMEGQLFRLRIKAINPGELRE